MDVNSAIAEIQTKALSLTGIRMAPPTPPEQLNVFPFWVTYERLGRLPVNDLPRDWATQSCTLYSELHVARTLLDRAITSAMGYRDLFLKKLLQDPNLGGDVMIVDEVRWTFGRLEWGGLETIGYRFEIDLVVELLAN